MGGGEGEVAPVDGNFAAQHLQPARMPTMQRTPSGRLPPDVQRTPSGRFAGGDAGPGPLLSPRTDGPPRTLTPGGRVGSSSSLVEMGLARGDSFVQQSDSMAGSMSPAGMSQLQLQQAQAHAIAQAQAAQQRGGSGLSVGSGAAVGGTRGGSGLSHREGTPGTQSAKWYLQQRENAGSRSSGRLSRSGQPRTSSRQERHDES